MATKSPEFSKRLTELLDLSGKTRKKFAESLGIREQTLVKYCKHGGVPEWDILLPMAQSLNVSVDFLLTGEDPGTLPEPLMRRLERLKPDDLRLLYVWLDGLLAGRED